MDCFTKVIEYDTFIEFTTPEQRYEFLFNRAVINYGENMTETVAEMLINAIKWCEANCDEPVILHVNNEAFTLSFYFKDHDDLLKFKLGYDDTVAKNSAGSR